MRLTAEQIAVIHRTAAEFFGADARVWLFGSRVDDRGVGGDIDLLIETDTKAELRQTCALRPCSNRRSASRSI